MNDRKKAVLVTGAGIRLGQQIAVFFAENGYDVALHYNNSFNEINDVKKYIEKIGVKSEIFKADFSKLNETEKLINDVFDKFPDLSVLINNAAIIKKLSLKDTSLEFLDYVFNVNLKSPIILSGHFACYVKKGVIINILDSMISKNKSTFPIYNLTKKALSDFTKISAVEFAPSIRVNGIAPGIVMSGSMENKKIIADIIEKTPLKSMTTVESLLQTIDFILKNDNITGEIIFNDGGYNI